MQNILVHTANADTLQIYMYEKNLYCLEAHSRRLKVEVKAKISFVVSRFSFDLFHFASTSARCERAFTMCFK